MTYITSTKIFAETEQPDVIPANNTPIIVLGITVAVITLPFAIPALLRYLEVRLENDARVRAAELKLAQTRGREKQRRIQADLPVPEDWQLIR